MGGQSSPRRRPSLRRRRHRAAAPPGVKPRGASPLRPHPHRSPRASARGAIGPSRAPPTRSQPPGDPSGPKHEGSPGSPARPWTSASGHHSTTRAVSRMTTVTCGYTPTVPAPKIPPFVSHPTDVPSACVKRPVPREPGGRIGARTLGFCAGWRTHSGMSGSQTLGCAPPSPLTPGSKTMGSYSWAVRHSKWATVVTHAGPSRALLPPTACHWP